MSPPNFVDLTGKTFGRLTVISRADYGGARRLVRYLCRCRCGNTTTVYASALRSRNTRSCGCLQREAATKHGCAKGKGTKEYRMWGNMIARCMNPNSSRYPHYGGRGIEVCQEWAESFEAYRDYIISIGFTGAMGQSIDRINNDGHYEPGNLRVATASEQIKNRSITRWITIKGHTRCLSDWAKTASISLTTLYTRIVIKGWDPEIALSTPACGRPNPKPTPWSKRKKRAVDNPTPELSQTQPSPRDR